MKEIDNFEELGVDGYLKCLLKTEDGTRRLDFSDSEYSVFMTYSKSFDQMRNYQLPKRD